VPEPIRIEPTFSSDTDVAIWANAVQQEGRNLIVLRNDSNSLMSVCEALIVHWQAHAPELKLVHFDAQQPARLLGQINEDLAQQDLHETMQASPPSQPHSVWFAHDAEHFSNDELMLLLRLNTHFPGWGVRWVLLFNLEKPLDPERQAWLAQADGHWLSWPETSLAQSLTGNSPGLAQTLYEATPLSSKKRVGLWATGLLVLAAAGGWLVLNNTNDKLPIEPHEPTAPAHSDAAPTSPTKAPALSAQNAGSTAAPLPPVKAGARPAAKTIPEVAQRGYRWLRTLPRDSFLLTHGVFETPLQAQRLIRTQAELNNARVLMLEHGGDKDLHFLVVTGPFRSEERARKYVVRKELPPQTRIESVDRMLKKSTPAPSGKSDRPASESAKPS
jgi:hypothetical protein